MVIPQPLAGLVRWTLRLVLLIILLLLGGPEARAEEQAPAGPGPVLWARLLLALMGLVVLGLGLLALVVLGGSMARRRARRCSPASRIDEDRWYSRPLVPPADDIDAESEQRQPE